MFLLIHCEYCIEEYLKTYLHSTMFLLIRHRTDPTGDRGAEFTFHYVSTYTRQKIKLSYDEINLHSTMFLLIPCQISSACPVSSHLHSTMFLLIPYLVGLQSTVKPHLHSTMFLLIPCRGITGSGKYSIYIPLCFYLYRQPVPHKSWPHTFTFHYVSTYTIAISYRIQFALYLHSTMFLLILTGVSLDQALRHIYIPLCFYLYDRQRKQQGLVIRIYIPLCFYLYVTGAIVAVLSYILFTFHYVSTYTRFLCHFSSSLF